jgi:hypothetical protein
MKDPAICVANPRTQRSSKTTTTLQIIFIPAKDSSCLML